MLGAVSHDASMSQSLLEETRPLSQNKDAIAICNRDCVVDVASSDFQSIIVPYFTLSLCHGAGKANSIFGKRGSNIHPH